MAEASPAAAAGSGGQQETAVMPHVIPADHSMADKVDAEYDAVDIPFEISDESFPVPARCADDLTAANGCSHSDLWHPGKALDVAYITWNMAQKPPLPDEVCDFCVRPNAHIVVVSTQENGPYIGLNTQHSKWLKLLESVCLRGNYSMIAQQSLWAVHLVVFARSRDVAMYIREVHVGVQKTGTLAGHMGNKGGVGIALTISLRQSTAARALGQARSKERSSFDHHHDGKRDGENEFSPRSGSEEDGITKGIVPSEKTVDPSRAGGTRSPRCLPELTFLFIGTHLTAHQENVQKRNSDYCSIVSRLPVGTFGPYGFKFAATMRELQHPLNAPSGGDAQLLLTRDVTEEFDFCFFGGDLNYRIGGSKRAIEFIVLHRKELRSVLTHNDQLISEMRKGVVFHGFEEGQLHFRPTYKYHMEGEVTQEEYDYKPKKPRMPAYCDRILLKRRACTHQLHPVMQMLYTDCPNVRTSDHRPVVGMWRIETIMFLDGEDGDDSPAYIPQRGCCAGDRH